MVGIRPSFLYKSERSSKSKALVEDDVEKLVPDPSILRGNGPCIGITLLDIVVAKLEGFFRPNGRETTRGLSRFDAFSTA